MLPRGSTGGTDRAEYCYEVWMKHLTMLHAHGMEEVPRVLAELGPGDSLGIGLSALLSGVERYYAFDVVNYSNVEKNLTVFDELVGLFEARAGRPSLGWPDYDGFLDDNLFPGGILTEERLSRALSHERIERIRDSIIDAESDKSMITYSVPWSGAGVIDRGRIETAISHAVLEHVADLDATYRDLSMWMKPGGLMSHQISFVSHGLTEEWNGHWAIPDPVWRMIMGRRSYLLNRRPCSEHIALIEKHGFEIIELMKKHRDDGIDRSRLTGRWKELSDDDLTCSDLYVIARKAETR